ncbi:hypothetical protein LBW90_09680 [Pantoea rwandensis]|nr:hypothetical protein [Pantoea sp. alder69]MCA1250820.1 hypothetical protein [Pantoea sp. alder70]MCA1265233.1 hypothetical protein [Pantoea sp. alder81]
MGAEKCEADQECCPALACRAETYIRFFALYF